MIAKLFSSPQTTWGGIIGGIATAWPALQDVMGQMNGGPAGQIDWRWVIIGAAFVWMGVKGRDNDKKSEEVGAGE